MSVGREPFLPSWGCVLSVLTGQARAILLSLRLLPAKGAEWLLSISLAMAGQVSNTNTIYHSVSLYPLRMMDRGRAQAALNKRRCYCHSVGGAQDLPG